MDSSADSVESVKRLQAFVRGSLCRARVSLMVKKLIDELIEAKGQKSYSMDAEMQQQDPAQKQNDESNTTASKENLSPGQLNKRTFEKSATDASTPPPPPNAASSPRRHLKDAVLQNNATKHVASSEDLVHEHEARLEMELRQLVEDIKRVGDPEKPCATFGELFDDDQVANYYEALVGTLKAAKKKGLVSYHGQILLKGISDNVVISIV